MTEVTTDVATKPKQKRRHIKHRRAYYEAKGQPAPTAKQSEAIITKAVGAKEVLPQALQDETNPDTVELAKDLHPALSKPVKTACIVIDWRLRWHQGVMVDLKGIDTSAFKWGYYGQNLPVLIQRSPNSKILTPFYLSDVVGESPNRLYKGANPDGFRATFKHRASLLHKIQVGLMAAIAGGTILLFYAMVSGKG
jgi:hypothetical protein